MNGYKSTIENDQEDDTAQKGQAGLEKASWRRWRLSWAGILTIGENAEFYFNHEE